MNLTNVPSPRLFIILFSVLLISACSKSDSVFPKDDNARSKDKNANEQDFGNGDQHDKLGISIGVGSYIPKKGLMAYYPLNGNVNDASGNGIHGIINGVTDTTDRHNKTGKAYYFNGSSNIVIPNYSFFNYMSEYTATAWVRTDTLGIKQFIISKGDPLRDIALKIDQNDLIMCHFQKPNYSLRTAYFLTPVNKRAWYHCAAVWTGTHLQIYVNGELRKSKFCYGDTVPWTGATMTIGSLVNSERFIGVIDEVAIYNRALTDLELAEMAKFY